MWFFLYVASDIYYFARKISRGRLGTCLGAVIAPFTRWRRGHWQLEPKANPQQGAGELTAEEAQRLIQCIKTFGAPTPLFILTGSDPAKRSDIFDLIA